MNNDLNLGLFHTQRFYMTSQDIDYSMLTVCQVKSPLFV